MKNIETTQMVQDYKANVDWIFKNYESAGVTLPNGFQKDAVQNAVGARAHDTWTNWKFKIDILENKKGTFLVLEDEGTEGLTGPNLSATKITELINNGEKIDSSWRLVRFSSRNVSGGNITGAGQYGVGKTVYSIASNDYDYCFDSLRADGKYVANRNASGQIAIQAYEDEDAKKYIKSICGLNPKETIGTRVIIINPREEIIDSINNGEFISFIQESWWKCIEKMPSSSGIYVNGKRVNLDNLPKVEDYPFHQEYNKPFVQSPGYRMKKFGFFISKNGENPWNGISYYRKGMKIGPVTVDIIPDKIKDKCWGYIEVDNEWEEKLSEIEDPIHYGVIGTKKRSTPYTNLKNCVSDKVQRLLEDWGFIKEKVNEDQVLKEALSEISSELQDLFDSMNFEDLGKGAKRPDFDVRLKDVVYPTIGSEKVKSGDHISFSFKITNNYATDRKFEYSIDIISKKDNHIVSSLEKDSRKIPSGKSFTNQYDYTVSKESAERYEENRIILVVKANGSPKEKRKELSFFFDLDKEDNSRREVLLTLHTADFPHENSKRINFNDTLSNITYRIENKQPGPIPFSLKLSIYDSSSKTTLANIGSFTGLAKPYEECIVDEIPDITFSEEFYSQYLDQGVLELRAFLRSNDETDLYYKGEKITHYYENIYLNKDEKNGKEGAFEPRTENEPDDPRRSWCKVIGSKRVISINMAHPAFIAAHLDSDTWKSYLKEEMLKQYVLLYLEEGKFSTFDKEKDLTEMDPVESFNTVLYKIEEVYKRSLL